MSVESSDHREEKPPLIWTTTLIFSLTFAAAITAVPAFGFIEGYSLAAWGFFAFFLIGNGIAITGGYHRLWSHKAYQAHWSIRLSFALLGAMATQNSILIWASGHRRHHRYVDNNDKDPYSAKRGFWFSHIGWMLREYRSGQVNFDNVKDLERDKIVMFQHNHYIALVLFMNIALPALIGFLFNEVIGFLLLSGVLRLVISHHVTFFINSLAHIWGSQPYTDENSARDNGLLAFVTYGEGYHNYHHIFQTDYRNGIRWYQFDPTKWFIALCSWLGLTWNLKRVSNFKIQRAIVTMQFKKAHEKLSSVDATVTAKWAALIEQEYEQYRIMVQEWTELQKVRYEGKRKELIEKWENAAILTKYNELEYGLKMQRKRLQLFMDQLPLTPVSA